MELGFVRKVEGPGFIFYPLFAWGPGYRVGGLVEFGEVVRYPGRLAFRVVAGILLACLVIGLVLLPVGSRRALSATIVAVVFFRVADMLRLWRVCDRRLQRSDMALTLTDSFIEPDTRPGQSLSPSAWLLYLLLVDILDSYGKRWPLPVKTLLASCVCYWLVAFVVLGLQRLRPGGAWKRYNPMRLAAVALVVALASFIWYGFAPASRW